MVHKNIEYIHIIIITNRIAETISPSHVNRCMTKTNIKEAYDKIHLHSLLYV